jgi:type I restriction enzyme M protein
LCRINLAVHGLEGDIRHGGNVNRYYDDPHDTTGRFDFVLANGSMSSNHSGKGDIRNGLIEAEKMNSNSWKVHHNIQS